MRSYRIVIEYTDASPYPRAHPASWYWSDMMAKCHDETVSVVNVEEIPTPEGHKEDLKDA